MIKIKIKLTNDQKKQHKKDVICAVIDKITHG